MENATKALLIAAAILIAIVLITLGISVIRVGQEAMGNMDLSEAEMATHNSKFESAAGTRVSGSMVNTLLATIVSSNADPNSKQEVTVTNNSSQTEAGISGTTVTKFHTGKYYKVTLTYTGGLVSGVSIADVT